MLITRCKGDGFTPYVGICGTSSAHMLMLSARREAELDFSAVSTHGVRLSTMVRTSRFS